MINSVIIVIETNLEICKLLPELESVKLLNLLFVCCFVLPMTSQSKKLNFNPNIFAQLRRESNWPGGEKMHVGILLGEWEIVESASNSGQEQGKSESEEAEVTSTSKMSVKFLERPWQHGQMGERMSGGRPLTPSLSPTLCEMRMCSVTCKFGALECLGAVRQQH